MIGPKPRVFWIYWVAMWLVVTPLVIVVCTIFYTYGQKLSHPKLDDCIDISCIPRNKYKWPTVSQGHPLSASTHDI